MKQRRREILPFTQLQYTGRVQLEIIIIHVDSYPFGKFEGTTKISDIRTPL